MSERNQAIGDALRQFHAAPCFVRHSVDDAAVRAAISAALKTMRDKPDEEPRRVVYWIHYHLMKGFDGSNAKPPTVKAERVHSKMRRGDKCLVAQGVPKAAAEKMYKAFCEFHKLI